jgi:hypothetical protein
MTSQKRRVLDELIKIDRAPEDYVGNSSRSSDGSSQLTISSNEKDFENSRKSDMVSSMPSDMPILNRLEMEAMLS